MTERIIVPKDRTFSRGQGCWNCSNSCSAVEFWTDKRKGDLLAIKALIAMSPEGQNDPVVARRMKMIDTTDHSVAAHALLRCTKGKTAEGNPIGDLVAHNYLCSEWSAATGASLAREGGKLDDLPEELADKLDGQPSKNLEDLVARKLIDD